MSVRLRTWLYHLAPAPRPVGPGVERTDGDLVEAFAATHSEEAFAELVRRHGPMVLATCRRVLHPDSHTADDAFQATFLVLATKAGAVSPPERVGAWLHGVAVHVAKRAKAWVRKLVPSAPADLDKVPAAFAEPDPDAAQLRTVIDAVLAGLPPKYRSAVVLCDLEGKSRAEAAAALGWSEGTLSGRLARARKLLADRLARRGVTLPAAGLAVGQLAPPAAASVPAHLAASTVTAATLVAAGAAAAEVTSAPVAALTRGGCPSMSTKFKLFVAGVAGFGLAVGGWVLGGLFAPPLIPLPPPPVAAVAGEFVAPAAPVPPAPKGWLTTHTFDSPNPVTALAFGPGLVATGDRAGVLLLWDVATGQQKEMILDGTSRRARSIDRIQFSPDGVWLYLTTDDGHSQHQCSVTPAGRAFPSVGGKGNWVGYGTTADGAYWLQRITAGGELMLMKNRFAEKVFGGFPDARFPHDQPIDNAAAGDADTVVTVSGGVLRRWSLGLQGPVWETRLGEITPTLVVVGPGSRVIAVALENGEVHLHAAETGKLLGKLGGHKGAVYAAAFSPDGKRLATGGEDRTARVWDAQGFQELAVLRGHAGPVTCAAFSPGGEKLATGSDDKTVKLWKCEK